MLKRIAFPEWCEIEIEADDEQHNYEKYRELFGVMLKHIALIKPIRTRFLQLLAIEINSI